MGSSLMPTPGRPSVGPESPVVIVLLALIFIGAVFAFYYFTR
jgi:hypothetical protein